MDALELIGRGFWNAFQMAWEVWWALVLGFLLSAIVQAWAPREQLERALGGRGPGTIALATGLGDGVPVRLDEPRLRARDRDLDLPRLAVHARRAGRRPAADRADVDRRAA